MKATDATERLRQAAATDRRSPLFLWMLANFDTFSATLAEAGRPNWKELARTFSELGMALPGTAPESVRKTWLSVRRVKAKAEGRRPAKVQRSIPPPSIPPAPVARSSPQASAVPAEDDRPQIIEPRSRFNFKPAEDRVKPPKGS